jgi:8-oxo-(d)GTP phosphatase
MLSSREEARLAIVRTAGGILWRGGPGRPRLAVIHRPRQGDWTLPKGKLDRGEGWRAAALREVLEETGCVARLGAFAGATCYDVKRGLKVVLYWNMELVREGRLERLHEVDEVRWLAPDDALGLLDHARERRLVERGAARTAPGIDARWLMACADAGACELLRAHPIVGADRAVARGA